jgi:hypothetical protein
MFLARVVESVGMYSKAWQGFIGFGIDISVIDVSDSKHVSGHDRQS